MACQLSTYNPFSFQVYSTTSNIYVLGQNVRWWHILLQSYHCSASPYWPAQSIAVIHPLRLRLILFLVARTHSNLVQWKSRIWCIHGDASFVFISSLLNFFCPAVCLATVATHNPAMTQFTCAQLLCQSLLDITIQCRCFKPFGLSHVSPFAGVSDCSRPFSKFSFYSLVIAFLHIETLSLYLHADTSNSWKVFTAKRCLQRWLLCCGQCRSSLMMCLTMPS